MSCTKKKSEVRLAWISMKFVSQHLMLTLIPEGRISSVSLVTKLGAGNRGIVMRFPAVVTYFSVLRSAQTGCATHPAPDSVGAGEEGLFLGGKTAVA
jgi:hypothetical protein